MLKIFAYLDLCRVGIDIIVHVLLHICIIHIDYLALYVSRLFTMAAAAFPRFALFVYLCICILSG